MIYLIRHGETDWNSEKRIQGREDIPLNDRGREQALLLRKVFEHISLDAAVSSPLLRAHDTASVIADAHGLSVITEPDLIEREFGILSAKSYEERDNMEALFKDSPLPGMEDGRALKKRMMAVIERYCASDFNNIVMVSHGAAIKAALRVMTDDDLSRKNVWLKNCCINIIDKDESSKPVLVRYNLSPEEFSQFMVNPLE